MSLVLIWPSTVIRLKEASTAARRRGVGVLDDGVGLDEAEHRRHVRLDHPRPLRLGGERHAADAQGAALRPAVGGEDRVGEGGAAVRGESAAAASSIPPRTASIGSGTPIVPVSATATCSLLEAELRRPRRSHIASASA